MRRERRVEMNELNRQGVWRERRRWLAVLVGISTLGVFGPSVVRGLGPVPHTLSTGTVVSASQLNENFAYLQNGITANESQVPTGMVSFFDTSTCPTGWSEVPSARGRALVGVNGSAGTVGGTVGTSLTDLEDRAHTHVVDVPSFDSARSSANHSHSVPSVTVSGGSHRHEWFRNGAQTWNSTGGTQLLVPYPVGSGTTIQPRFGTSSSADYFTDSEPVSLDIPSRTSGWSSAMHDHTVDPPAAASAGASTSTVIPYAQFLVCRRD